MVPSVVPTNDNQRHHDGVVVQRWIDGRPPDSEKDWTAVAAELQRLHALTVDHPQRPGCCVVTDLHNCRVSVDADLDAMSTAERSIVEAVFEGFPTHPQLSFMATRVRRIFG